MEAKNNIPLKKLIASGTNRFDKDTYCKIKLTVNTLTFLHKSFPTGLLSDDEKRSASDNWETIVENIASEQAERV